MLLNGMFSCIISSSSISPIANPNPYGPITMITSPTLPYHGVLIVFGLIILLTLKEILSSSAFWNKYLNNSFNLAIAPLFLTFIAIVIYIAMQNV